MTRFSTYADDIKAALTDRLVPIDGGPLDGQMMLSSGVMLEALASVPYPPPDAQVAELRTPATVYLDALCHICGERAPVTVRLESKTTVDDKRRVLTAKVDAATVDHLCGQMRLVGDEPEEPGQAVFDWTIPVASAIEDVPHIVDMLRRVGVGVTSEDIDRWTEPEREAAAQWAVAAHVALTDGVLVPDPPDHVGDDFPAIDIDPEAYPLAAPGWNANNDAPIEPGDIEDPDTGGTWAEDEPGAAYDATAVCPFPGCTLGPEHRGRHRGMDGKTIRPDAAEPDPDAAAPEDGADLLP